MPKPASACSPSWILQKRWGSCYRGEPSHERDSGEGPARASNGLARFGALPRLDMFTAINSAEGDNEPERIMVRVKSNIGPSGGGFGYRIDSAPLLEHPDIEATRIVWELPLEGSARELLAKAENE